MKRQRWMTFAMIVLIFVGLGIMLYPTANGVYNRWKANREIEKYNQVAEAEQADYSDLWEAAEAYNRRLARNGSFSGTVDAAQQQEIAGLLNPLGTGMMGYIDIPDNEVVGQINPVFMRVCGLLNCMVRQEYDKITCLKGLK